MFFKLLTVFNVYIVFVNCQQRIQVGRGNQLTARQIEEVSWRYIEKKIITSVLDTFFKKLFNFD